MADSCAAGRRGGSAANGGNELQPDTPTTCAPAGWAPGGPPRACPHRVRAEVLLETLLLCVLGGALGVLVGSLSVGALGELRFSDDATLAPRFDGLLLAAAFGVLVATADDAPERDAPPATAGGGAQRRKGAGRE